MKIQFLTNKQITINNETLTISGTNKKDVLKHLEKF
jgi:hypothetical protein